MAVRGRVEKKTLPEAPPGLMTFLFVLPPEIRGKCRVMNARWAVFALGLACLGLPAALAAEMPRGMAGETPRRYSQFLFLYESTRSADQSDLVLRLPLPIYSRYRNDERAYDFQTVLYPVFWSHGTNHWRKWTFLFFFSGDDTYHADSNRDSDLLLAPLFYWGRGDSEKERYFSFFPLYGTIKNKLSYSEINFVLFPLYVNWTYREYKAHGVLWPLVMWGGSSVRSELRIFPFYSSKVHEGKYERRSILWPFIQWGREGLDRKEPRGYAFLWPFYARKYSDDDNLSVHAILPFFLLPVLVGPADPLTKLVAAVFSFMPFASWGRDNRTNAKSLNALWFLYQYETNDNPYVRKRIIFPFWGTYRFADKEADFYGPFYVKLRTHSLVFESETDVVAAIVPLYWRTDRFYLQDWRKSHFLKMWPFFQYMKDSNGNVSFQTLALWPTRDDDFERLWGPLYGLVEYREFENGDRFFSLFFRIYSQYWNATEFHLFVLGFDFRTTPRYWSASFLNGFVGVQHDYPLLGPDGKVETSSRNTLQLLWMRI